MENKITTMRTGTKEKLPNVTMQEGTMREEERGGDEGGQQWGYSAGKGCLLLHLFFEESGCVRVHAVLVYLTRSFPVPSQKHGL